MLTFAPVKALSVIMMVLLFLAGFDLCTDGLPPAGVQITIGSPERCEDHAAAAPCSPFCTCAQCPFSVIVPANAELREFVRSIRNQYPGAAETGPSSLSGSIWQPPKENRYNSV
jgi:hypothetical protein